MEKGHVVCWERQMKGQLLIHVTSGVENPTRAALGLLVARSALEADYSVDVFVAGDGVSLIRPETAEKMHGVGTGSVAEHLRALKEGGARLYASGMSCAARGLGPEQLKDLGFTPSPPAVVVDLAFEADRTLTY